MPLPSFMSEDRQFEGVTEVAMGPVRFWVGWDYGFGRIVAFAMTDQQMVRVEPDSPELHVLTQEHLKKVPGVRFARALSEADFVSRWERETDPYLFPKRKGKLVKDWTGFTPDIPLGVLADWLEENGLSRAATLLRNADELLPAVENYARAAANERMFGDYATVDYATAERQEEAVRAECREARKSVYALLGVELPKEGS